MVLILVLAMALIAGCGMTNKKTANQMLQDAFVKSSELKSASIDGFMELNLELSDDLLATLGPDEQMIIETIKNTKISYRGNYQLAPQQAEIILSADVPFGDLKMNIELPILMLEEKIWIKVPSLPIPGMDAFAGKFIEMDLKQLAEQSGEPIPNLSDNIQAYTKFSNEVTPVFFKHFDETYFNKIDVKNLSLSSNANVKDAVEFKIAQNQLKPFITTVVEKVMPEMFDIMAKDEYQKLFGLTPDMVAEAKKELTVSPTDLDEAMAEMEKVLSNFFISAIFAIDKNGFMPQQTYTIASDFKNPEGPGTGSFKLNVIMNTTKINEKVTFENSFPPSPVIPFEELLGMGMGMMDDPFADTDWSEDDFAMEESDDDELFALYDELFNQSWFIANEAAIDDLTSVNMEFTMELMNPDVIRALIDDADFRAEFFQTYGLQLEE